MKTLNRYLCLAVAAVVSVVMGSPAFATDPTPTVSDVITSSGLTTNMTSAATTLAGVLGTCLIIWFAFRLFYKGRRAAGKAVG